MGRHCQQAVVRVEDLLVDCFEERIPVVSGGDVAGLFSKFTIIWRRLSCGYFRTCSARRETSASLFRHAAALFQNASTRVRLLWYAGRISPDGAVSLQITDAVSTMQSISGP